MKTTFDKIRPGEKFYIFFSNGRTIFYIKKEDKGNNAYICGLDYYTNQADVNCIGNPVYIDPLTLVYKIHN